MGNSDEMQTPKGPSASGDVGLHKSYYIGKYKGGRNESFMYGTDKETVWYDYDLTSAYTTGMADLALPDYYNGSLIDPSELKNWTAENFLNGYLIVNGDFSFPEHVKYPSIPCYVDKTTTVYPLNGSCYLTGPEYWLAIRQGCEINIKSAFYIHPKIKKVFKKEEVELIQIKPFKNIINDIQCKRREFSKGTIENALYKEMGNSIYGNVVRGISYKKTFDSVTGKNLRVTATELSNPILASWTTAFIRSVIGECLHNIQKLGGRVVSVTTDGFITDLPCLETKLMSLGSEDTPLFSLYRSLREGLRKNPESLEIKHFGKGVVSWTTRGQLGIGSGIKATTGFQVQGYDKSELVTIFKDTLKGCEKYF